jgi:hypothetical protein
MAVSLDLYAIPVTELNPLTAAASMLREASRTFHRDAVDSSWGRGCRIRRNPQANARVSVDNVGGSSQGSDTDGPPPVGAFVFKDLQGSIAFEFEIGTINR